MLNKKGYMHVLKHDMKHERHEPKPKTIAELKTVLLTIWDSLPQQSIGKAAVSFRKRLQACVRANGGHFEHVLIF